MAKATFPGQPQPAGAVLDGERYLEVLTPLPQDSGVDMRLKVRMNSITDKGKYAVVERESVVFCAKTGKEFVRMFSSTIFVGVTGFQSAGEPFFKKISFPDRAPDATVEEKVSETQTQIYRLSGDYNPLHICPDTAKAFGFPAPILHGLCTFGHSARHVIQKFAGNDARRLRSVRVRFSKPVLPGQTLRTEMWRADDASRVVFRTVVKETGAVVMTNCEATLQTADDSAAAPTSFQSEAVFQQMQARLTPTIMGKVQAVFRFVVKNGPVTRTWRVDAKTAGTIEETADGDADCTIKISDSNLVKLVNGELDGMQAFMQGKIKLQGNMMLAQKLALLGNTGKASL
ncbi:MAG: hypothetical protein MHM6MM_001956 [Cercozoa sp. M6MM]